MARPVTAVTGIAAIVAKVVAMQSSTLDQPVRLAGSFDNC